MTAEPRAICLLLVAAACSRTQGTSAAKAPGFQDAEGRTVTINHLPVRRIVSTTQSVTEWLVLLGASDRLVARTDFDHEPGLAALPSIGGGLDPGAEAVVALKPDVVLGWHDRSSADLQRALLPFHIPVLSFETTDTADVFGNLRRLGELVGRPERAESLASDLRARLHAVRSDACPSGTGTAPTVLLVLWTDPPMTTGGGTWMTTLLDVACLRNVFADVRAPWPTVSMEAIAARRPDWILTSRGLPGQRLADLRSKPGWRDLDAVRAGRVIEIPGDLLARAGPTIADAARAIVDARRAIERP
ncbi:MAG: ABC transporter substrate-binding protein [Gemmatimonadales bacterium]